MSKRRIHVSIEIRAAAGPIVAAVVLALVACGGSSGGSTSPPTGSPAPPPEQPPPTPPPVSPPDALAIERVYPNLSFENPVALLQAPGDSSRWFVVEQGGRVLVFDDNAAVTVTSPFVDLRARVRSGGETGLLGMAFHPAFPQDGRAWLVYTADEVGLVSRISEFSSPDGGLTLDPNSERVLITIAQPETNHNGGGIAFGPDGRLYVAIGDGGGTNDPHGEIGNGQRTTTLLGKILRIDVDATPGSYGIPADNPFAGSDRCSVDGTGLDDCPEIHAWGFRNPWRFSFDRSTGDLWVGDVGQGAIEEIDRVERGGNYGWRCFEGTRATGLACGDATGLMPPVAQYGRELGRSVTGGFVYRGTAVEGLAGRYVFGDFISGRLWHIAGDVAPTLTVTGGEETGLSIASLAESVEGELYVVDYSGALHRITAGD
jgi:glucose/arabinose dehydrogenase